VSLTLGQKRKLFSRYLVQLIDHAHSLGYEVQVDEVKRGREQAKWNATHCGTCHGTKRSHTQADHEFHAIGIEDSLHRDGLAVDLVLFVGSSPLWSTKRYRELGLFWESLHPLNFWGGPTRKPGDRLRRDGVHFAMSHGEKQ